MNVQRHRSGMMLLLLGVVLFPVITVSQSADRDLGIVRVRYVTIVVRDYAEALHWYTDVLGLEKTEEGTFGAPVAKSGAVQTPGDKRWIVVAPRGRKDVGIILEIAKPFAANDSIRNYEARVGTETRWVFEVEDCRKFYDRASKRGIKFVETPVDQPWGVTEAIFEDLYGNIFVVESFRPKPGTPGR
jgi:catechol 2,3-dioxygenase-like lactoylglutathione lyase family enzyme